MSEDHVQEIANAESLRQLVEERLQSSEAANSACRLAGLSIRGNAAQKRGRLLDGLVTPVRLYSRLTESQNDILLI